MSEFVDGVVIGSVLTLIGVTVVYAGHVLLEGVRTAYEELDKQFLIKSQKIVPVLVDMDGTTKYMTETQYEEYRQHNLEDACFRAKVLEIVKEYHKEMK